MSTVFDHGHPAPKPRRALPPAPEFLDRYFDRLGNQARDTRRVEWLAVLLLAAALALGLGSAGWAAVQRANQAALQAQLRGVYLAVQSAQLLCGEQLAPGPGGQADFTLAPPAGQDDANGAVLRPYVQPLLAGGSARYAKGSLASVAGQAQSYLQGAASLPQSAPAGAAPRTGQDEASLQAAQADYVWAAQCRGGQLTVQLWRDQAAYAAAPAQPDAVYTTPAGQEGAP